MRAIARPTPLRLLLQACVCVAVHRGSHAIPLDLQAALGLHPRLIAERINMLPCGRCGSKGLPRAVRCAACADHGPATAAADRRFEAVAIAIPAVVGLHLGFHPYLHFSAHAPVPVVLLGCVSVARAV